MKIFTKNTDKFLSYPHEDPDAVNQLSRFLLENTPQDNIIILCVGTDRCIGDALGPLVGTFLEKRKFPYPIYGTLAGPVHALNLYNRMKEIHAKHPDAFVIAIDASLGEAEQVGNISIRKSPLHPGKGVGKTLPSVGDLSIVGIVEDVNYEVATSIHQIRLHFIMSLVDKIVEILTSLSGRIEITP